MTEKNVQQLVETANKVHIEGVLKEAKFVTGSGKNGEWIRAEFTIATAENDSHTIKSFHNKKTKKGEINQNYEKMIEARNTYKAEADDGVEVPDKVVINAGQITSNDWKNDQGVVVENTQINSNFINRVQGNYEPKATFSSEVIVQYVKPEIGTDGEETGRADLRGLLVNYSGRVVPVDYKVFKGGADFVLDNYEVGSTVLIKGDIINQTIVTETAIETAFGDPMIEKSYKTVKEFLIKSGSQPYEEENPKSFSKESVSQALVERQTFLDGLDAYKKKGETTTATPANAFGSDPDEKTRRTDISDDDLPF